MRRNRNQMIADDALRQYEGCDPASRSEDGPTGYRKQECFQDGELADRQ